MSSGTTGGAPIRLLCVSTAANTDAALHALVQQTLSTHDSPPAQSLVTVQKPPGPASGTHSPPVQCADGSQPASVVHEVAQVGGDCAVALVHTTAGYGPQALASIVAQPLSSSRVAVVHCLVGEQTPSTRVAWQVPGVAQVGAWP